MAKWGTKEIMTAKSALNAVSDEIGPVEMSNINELTIYIVGSAGVVSGAVQVEEAHLSGYAGTWAPNGSPVTVTADTVKSVKVAGVAHVARARVSTVLAGGTVSCFALGR